MRREKADQCLSRLRSGWVIYKSARVAEAARLVWQLHAWCDRAENRRLISKAGWRESFINDDVRI